MQESLTSKYSTSVSSSDLCVFRLQLGLHLRLQAPGVHRKVETLVPSAMLNT